MKIPRRKSRAHYLSPSTQSIVVYEGTEKLGAFDTVAGNTACGVQSGATFCSFRMGIVPGLDKTFVVSAYDGLQGAGALLSRGQVTRRVRTGLNVIPITLFGVARSIEIALQEPDPPAGTRATIGVTVMAKDRDGNVIVGPGDYDFAIQLSSSDAKRVALSTSRVTGPNQTVDATYDGSSGTSVTIGAVAIGVQPQNVTPATLAPLPTPVGDFALPSGDTKHSEQPTAIVAGADGNLWFAAGDANFGIFRMTTAGVMTFFQAGVAPSTNLPPETLTGLVAGSDGNVWYAGGSYVGSISPAGVATNYTLAGGALCAGANAQRIVDAADGGLWVSIQCSTGGQLAHVTRTGVQTLFNLPGLEMPDGLVLGKDGNVYLAGQLSSNLDAGVAQAKVSGSSVASVALVDVGAAQFAGLVGIAQSKDGDLWTTTGSCTPSEIVRVHLAATFAASNVAAFPTTAGCARPYFPIALADGTLWIPNFATPTTTHVVPGIYPAAPVQTDVTLPTLPSVPGAEVEAALGPDGNLYFADDSAGIPGYAGDVAKLAY